MRPVLWIDKSVIIVGLYFKRTKVWMITHFLIKSVCTTQWAGNKIHGKLVTHVVAEQFVTDLDSYFMNTWRLQMEFPPHSWLLDGKLLDHNLSSWLQDFELAGSTRFTQSKKILSRQDEVNEPKPHQLFSAKGPLADWVCSRHLLSCD